MNFERLILAQINAHYSFLVEEGLPVHIAVDTQYPGVEIPENLKIAPSVILNISMVAVEHLNINERVMTFSARFNGRSFKCVIPIRAIGGFPIQLPGSSSRVMLPLVSYPETVQVPERKDAAASSGKDSFRKKPEIATATSSAAQPAEATNTEGASSNVVNLFKKS